MLSGDDTFVKLIIQLSSEGIFVVDTQGQQIGVVFVYVKNLLDGLPRAVNRHYLKSLVQLVQLAVAAKSGEERDGLAFVTVTLSEYSE